MDPFTPSKPLISTNEDEIPYKIKTKEIAQLQSQGIVDQSSDLVFSRNGDKIPDMEPHEVKKVDLGDLTEKAGSISLLIGKAGSTKSSTGSYKNSEDVLREAAAQSKLLSEQFFAPYWKLYNAIIFEEDWEFVKYFIGKDPKVMNARITETCNTIFHLITISDHDVAIDLLKKYAPKFKESLVLKNIFGYTPLLHAAAAGNIKAVKIIVDLNKELPNIKGTDDFLPIHIAALYGRGEIVQYLVPLTKLEKSIDGSDGKDDGVLLLQLLVKSNLYGVALDLLKRNPNLARERNSDRKIVLESLACKPFGFASGSQLGCWQRLIYNCIPVKEKIISSGHSNNNDFISMEEDMENPIERSRKYMRKSKRFPFLGQSCQNLHMMFWDAVMQLVPSFKRIYDRKLTHMQSHEIVRIMCAGVVWTYEQASETLKEPVLKAARLGISEFVDESIKAYNGSFCFANDDGNNVFQLAVLHRHENVFNLIYKMGPMKEWLAFHDKSYNNILHLAGRSVPSSRVAGSAFQMQRELQWFKAVKNLVHPSLQEQQNSSKKIPMEVFVEEHKQLVKDGEEWMKETAKSYTFVAALISTVVFAAAFTVPGDTTGGVPTYLHETSFIIFAISDALALFSSTTSVLMFLGILTARYSEEDFLESLPKKLIIGLITLFFSIASMMVAFGATFYIVISHPWKWSIIPISLLGCIPVTLFALLQFPLLLQMLLSTYGPSIFQPVK